MVESILSGLGSIASIVGLVFIFRNPSVTGRLKALLCIILLLTIATSALSYRNYILSSPEETYRRRTEMAVGEAVVLLRTFPGYIDQYSPGDNEGIIYGGIALLEKYKDLFPESYRLIRENALADVQRAKSASSDLDYRYTMKRSAESMYRVIRGVGGTRVEGP